MRHMPRDSREYSGNCQRYTTVVCRALFQQSSLPLIAHAILIHLYRAFVVCVGLFPGSGLRYISQTLQFSSHFYILRGYFDVKIRRHLSCMQGCLEESCEYINIRCLVVAINIYIASTPDTVCVISDVLFIDV
jgi:hypothetical protein